MASDLTPQEATPGQAAYEARQRSHWERRNHRHGDRPPTPWADLTDGQRADEDAAAAAVMLMAQATVDYAELQEARDQLQEIHDALAAAWPGKELTEGAEALLVGALIAERDKAQADLAGIQHGAGAWVRETVARETAGIEAQRNEARAECASLTAEREKLSGACQLLARTLSMYVRSLYATWIDAAQHRNLKAVIEATAESLDGFDGPEWNGTETGTEWLERTRGVDVVSEPLSENAGPAAETASVLADPETMAAIAEGDRDA